MEKLSPGDLNSVKAEFEAWRAIRKSREKIPERLWESAISLLDYYPFHKVRKELKLNAGRLLQRAKAQGKAVKLRSNNKAAKPSYRSKSAFLEMTVGSLADAAPSSTDNQITQGSDQSCRIVFERSDGSRLSLNLPVEWSHIESICSGFLKA